MVFLKFFWIFIMICGDIFPVIYSHVIASNHSSFYYQVFNEIQNAFVSFELCFSNFIHISFNTFPSHFYAFILYAFILYADFFPQIVESNTYLNLLLTIFLNFLFKKGASLPLTNLFFKRTCLLMTPWRLSLKRLYS